MPSPLADTRIRFATPSSESGIQELGVANIMRVSANGSTFFFYINGKLVGEVSDPDYASGEVGLFVQTIDSPDALIHFDSIIIWDTQTETQIETQTPAAGTIQGTREQCYNEKDDDGDRLIDKADPDCKRPDEPAPTSYP